MNNSQNIKTLYKDLDKDITLIKTLYNLFSATIDKDNEMMVTMNNSISEALDRVASKIKILKANSIETDEPLVIDTVNTNIDSVISSKVINRKPDVEARIENALQNTSGGELLGILIDSIGVKKTHFAEQVGMGSTRSYLSQLLKDRKLISSKNAIKFADWFQNRGIDVTANQFRPIRPELSASEQVHKENQFKQLESNYEKLKDGGKGYYFDEYDIAIKDFRGHELLKILIEKLGVSKRDIAIGLGMSPTNLASINAYLEGKRPLKEKIARKFINYLRPMDIHVPLDRLI